MKVPRNLYTEEDPRLTTLKALGSLFLGIISSIIMMGLIIKGACSFLLG